MSRRGENIYLRKDGRWEGRYIKGRRADGRIRYGSIYGYKYQEVRERLTLLKAEYSRCRYHQTGFSGTLKDWTGYWLEVLERPYIRLSTYTSYQNKLKNHIIPVLGNKRLDKLSDDDIQMFVDTLKVKGLQNSSIGTVFRILKTALNKAVDRRCLFVNPCQKVIVPSALKNDKKVLSVIQQKQLEYLACHTADNAAVLIALHTGMRIGEISALQWADVDFDSGVIHVQRTLQRLSHGSQTGQKTQIIQELPKTGLSRRTIPMSQILFKHLQLVKAKSSSPYVVSCKDRYAEPRLISYRFNQLMRKVSDERITFHSLRHTFATRSIEWGIDIVTLSHLLGHSSAKMTLDVYAHSTIEQRRLAMDRLDAKRRELMG